MRILMTASRSPTYLASEYRPALEAAGDSIIPHFGADERPSKLPPIARRIVRRAYPHALWAPSNRDLLSSARAHKPDLVWLFKGVDVFPETVRTLRREGFHPVCYNADHPFEFFSRGSGNDNVTRSVPEYELFITFSRHIAGELAGRYPDLPTAVIPFGHAVDDATYESIAGTPEIVRVCFLGNPDRHRLQKIAALLDAGIEVDVYGYDWHKAGAKIAKARLLGPKLGLEMYRTLRQYRVQLNFLRPHNVNSHNMRTFEAPASGAIMLAEDTVEHREFFRPGHEAFYFSSDEELIAQARHLLSLSPEDATAIRTSARQRSVEQPFSYHERAALARQHFTTLIQK